MPRVAGNRVANAIRACAAIASLVLPPAAAGAAEPQPATFGDWMVGCDNVRHCTALSLPHAEDEPIAYLRLDRAAGPDAPAKLILQLFGTWGRPVLAVEVKLDGAPPIHRDAKQPGADGEIRTLAFEPAETAALLAAARKATQLMVTAPGLSARVSLSGFVAAMLRIDEQQGRLGTPTAIIRKGSGTRVPAAHAPPVVIARPASVVLPEERRKALAAALRRQVQQEESDLCDDEPSLIDSDTAWPLDHELRLVGIGCSRGAYNLTTGFWTMKGDDLATARPVIFPEAEDGMENMLTNADYDPKTGRLEFFSKGRGIGDCGTTGSYAWTGASFALVALSTMGECRGIGSNDWIQLYRSVLR